MPKPWWDGAPELDGYAEAVRAARAAGMSWGEIGRVLGVAKQLLHRRFRNDVG